MRRTNRILTRYMALIKKAAEKKSVNAVCKTSETFSYFSAAVRQKKVRLLMKKKAKSTVDRSKKKSCVIKPINKVKSNCSSSSANVADIVVGVDIHFSSRFFFLFFFVHLFVHYTCGPGIFPLRQIVDDHTPGREKDEKKRT